MEINRVLQKVSEQNQDLLGFWRKKTKVTPDPSVTEKRISWVCTAASGAVDAKQVADGIHAALSGSPPNDGSTPTQSDNWPLLGGDPYRGECDQQARFMVRGVKMVGSSGTAYITYASVNDGEVDTPDSKVVNGKTYWLKFDFYPYDVADNNFEGSVESAGYYYAVWPSLKANSKINLLRQVGPDSFGANQVWVETEGGVFGGRALSQLPGTEPYPPANP